MRNDCGFAAMRNFKMLNEEKRRERKKERKKERKEEKEIASLIKNREYKK